MILPGYITPLMKATINTKTKSISKKRNIHPVSHAPAQLLIFLVVDVDDLSKNYLSTSSRPFFTFADFL